MADQLGTAFTPTQMLAFQHIFLNSFAERTTQQSSWQLLGLCKNFFFRRWPSAPTVSMYGSNQGYKVLELRAGLVVVACSPMRGGP